MQSHSHAEVLLWCSNATECTKTLATCVSSMCYMLVDLGNVRSSGHEAGEQMQLMQCTHPGSEPILTNRRATFLDCKQSLVSAKMKCQH